mmetsp:Transcript_6876/g.9778  ORF Transcript_6876/g.9778 Transcript_6876/m.9778 type:complete len:118 (+) Transcript_6876:1793-2146(+)|eukprot:CAMPEP_0170077624 /NCGR_PEP_ID=MMETSP0019_2-20121128/14404_1 /TAXON_ID=98059 /ORGANISM="Dinobryon sp., Strain UTEXLB2267" /LENGTH=117 /DNA_ID=CAMNT_0010290065 /DNA_START=2158 /DNA_END=2511 /DNA_ORIENTATION=-
MEDQEGSSEHPTTLFWMRTFIHPSHFPHEEGAAAGEDPRGWHFAVLSPSYGPGTNEAIPDCEVRRDFEGWDGWNLGLTASPNFLFRNECLLDTTLSPLEPWQPEQKQGAEVTKVLTE